MTMDLGRLLGDPEIEPDLLVQLTADQMGEDLLFPYGEPLVSCAKLLEPPALLPFRITADQRPGNRIQQLVAVGCLGEKIDRPA